MADEPQNSPKHESLDEIVSHSAIVLAEQIQKAAAWAGSEMDLQIEVAGALKEFARRAQVTLEGHHNITIATGRPDSVYGSVIVEYKEPGVLSPNRDAAGNKKVIEQLKQRFYDFRREEGRKWPTMFGVGTDGKYFIFLRFRDEKWTDQEPLPVDRYSTERFLWALYNLGQKGKPYQPEYLHGDFGSDSVIAQEGVRTLYEEIRKTENPKAQVLFNQWKILFGEVCGYDVENLSDKVQKLAQFYGVIGSPEAAPLLFAVHTYYAVLIKLLAAEIVSFFNPWMPRQIERLLNATTSIKLKHELEELERGGIFYQMGITNFLEGDLFSWYLSIWNAPIEEVVRRMMSKLDEYNPGTFSEDPVQSRDLLKKLYQQLFPKSVRHDLGEYYTPDWLAEHVLNELGYEGDPDKRILDPACGSGTFLVIAINRIRRWYDHNREKLAYDEGDLLKKILANVIGFDLNPLAVMAARTNYLVAIKDLVRHSGNVEIPVYLCDSVMTPAEYGNLFTGGSENTAKVPCSAMKPPYLLVPKEIAQNPKDVAKYADILERAIRNGYTPEEFLSRCQDEGLTITATTAHLALYGELVALDKANKNGIWARIIKNNFAPLFISKVDYVAGNPPWVAYENLPAEYRESSAKIWQGYKLFPKGGWRARFAKGNTELAMVFTYASADCYLKPHGKLGFVITQSVFQSKDAGKCFRAFTLDAHRKFRITRVDDFTAMQPFEGASNRTATFSFDISKEGTSYPLTYTRWKGEKRSRFDVGDSLRSQSWFKTDGTQSLAC
jgi:N-6 DNA Methylase